MSLLILLTSAFLTEREGRVQGKGLISAAILCSLRYSFSLECAVFNAQKLILED